MATKKRKPVKRGLGETDPPVVIAQVRNRRNVADTLFKRQNDDSVLKTVVVYGLAIGGSYFGAKLLLNMVSKDLAESRNTNATNRILDNAAADPQKNPGAAAAVELAYAINKNFDSANPKANWSIWDGSVGGGGDEVRIFRVLAGEIKRNFWGSIEVVKGTYGQVQSREFYAQIVGYYKTMTGRDLEKDLRQALDPPLVSGDWDALQPYLRKIKCTSRKVDTKTKKVTYVKQC